MKKGYVGTYTEKGSQGIYRFLVDEASGGLSQVSLFAKVKNSKYLALTKEYLFSVFDGEEGSGVIVFALDGRCIDCCIYENTTSCFIQVVGEFIYTANYHLGTVTKLKFTNKLEVVASSLIKEKAGCHQVIACQGKILVPCLYLDCIKIFDENLGYLGEIIFPKGSGCRHGVVSKDEQYLYVIGELSNILYVVDLHTYQIVNNISVLPNGEINKEGSAAIRLSEDGVCLFVSTRDENIITVVNLDGKELEITSIFSTEGDHPRDILNIIDDQYLLVANRNSNEILSFAIRNGYKLVNKIFIPESVSIVIESE